MIAKADTHPLRAIREKCFDCSGGSQLYVRFCTCHGRDGSRCALWPFRFGIRATTVARRLGRASEILLDPERMPPSDIEVGKCPEWLDRQLAEMKAETATA